MAQSWLAALIVCVFLLALSAPFAVEAKHKPADIVAVHLKDEPKSAPDHMIARKKGRWADEDDEDDDDDEDEDEDDEGNRRRKLLAEEVEMKSTPTSARFTAYLGKNPGFMKQVVYIGVIGRPEVVEACKELAGGKTSFETDVNEVKAEGDLDIGDDLQKTEINHQYGCTQNKGAKVKLHPQVQTGEVFGLIKVGEKKVEHLVDCIKDSPECNVWQLAPPEVAKTLPDGQVQTDNGGGRKLKFAGVVGALAPTLIQTGASIVAPIAASVGQKAAAAISSGCFPADALVRMVSGDLVPISQLQHGDRVLAMMPDGQLGYDEVYMFGHKDFQAVSQFVLLKTEAGTVVRATKDHFIHAAKPSTTGAPGWSDLVHTQFGSVEVGDYIFSTDLGRAVRVTEVQQQAAKGLYNPYTMSGNMVVDGTSVSAHSNLLNMDKVVGTGPNAPHVYQALLAPVRAIYRLHPGLLRHVDSLYSENGWVGVGAGDVLRAIVQYHLNVVSA